MPIEYTRQEPPDEEEQFECDFCEFVYPVSVDHETIDLYVNLTYGRRYVHKIICVSCSDKINEATKEIA